MLATDNKNSVLSEVSEQGRKAIAYSAYGFNAEDASAQSGLGYNGELQDSTTGHYFLGKGYRVFSPEMMRFFSPDSWSPFGEGGVNAYAYVAWDPMRYSDSTGHVGSPVVGLVLNSFRRLAVNTSDVLSTGVSRSASATDDVIAAGNRVLAKTNAKTPDIPAPDYPWSSAPSGPSGNVQKTVAHSSSLDDYAASLDAKINAHGPRIINKQVLTSGRPSDIPKAKWKEMTPGDRFQIFNDPAPAKVTSSASSSANVRVVRQSERSRGVGGMIGKRHENGRFDT